jgi:hypothetical protein
MNEVAHAASKEAAKQAVILVFSVVGVVVTMAIAQTASDPDSMRTLRMASALEVKRFCQRQADRFQDWADKAATVYNQEKA